MAPGRVKLDDRDIKILSILQKEGRISKAALAERVNLSPTPCWERLRRLEREGVIESYGANVAPAALGPHTVLLVMIEIESHRQADFAAFDAAVVAMPEITECWSITGGYDYLCKFVTRDLATYQRAMDELLEKGPGVKRFYTYPAMRRVKSVPVASALLREE